MTLATQTVAVSSFKLEAVILIAVHYDEGSFERSIAYVLGVIDQVSKHVGECNKSSMGKCVEQ
jgi:hypothetical protein